MQLDPATALAALDATVTAAGAARICGVSPQRWYQLTDRPEPIRDEPYAVYMRCTVEAYASARRARIAEREGQRKGAV